MATSHRYWKFIIIIIFVAYNLSEASSKKPIPSDSAAVVVVGTVYCDTCFHQDFSKASHFIPGASVEIECSRGTGAGVFRQAVKTNERGEFKVKLAMSISKNEKKIEGCKVKLIKSGEPYCDVGSKVISSTLHLKSKKQRTHVFSAGFFTFRPLKQPEVCDQKPSFHTISNPELPTLPIQDPPLKSDLPPIPSTGGQGFLPPLPGLPGLPGLPKIPPLPIPSTGGQGFLPPLPGLPKLPPLPDLPGGAPLFPPIPKTILPSSNSLSMETVSSKYPLDFIPFFPPLPLLPPPSIFPPIPLLPPPSILPPVLPTPPPSILPPVLPTPPPSLFPPILPSPPTSGLPLPPVFPFPISPPPPPPGIIPPVFPFPGTPPSLPFPPLIPGVPPTRPPVSTPSLPPFPFQPTPGFPGVHPATNANPSKQNTP